MGEPAVIRRLATLAFLAGSLCPAQSAGPTIVSLNMCTDQLVLALADDDQILGLSPFARDPGMSRYAVRAAGFPRLSGLAEDVLPLRPQIVLTATFAKPDTRALLLRTGLRVEAFDAAASIAQVRQQIRRAGALLGHPDRAEAAIRRIDVAVEQARAAARATPLHILPLERRGWVSGRDSLTTDMLAQVGALNLGDAATNPVGGRLSLETIIALRPERLLLSAPDDRADDQGSALLRHPALSHSVPAQYRLILPEALTVCGGPMLAEAFERLILELRAPGQSRH